MHLSTETILPYCSDPNLGNEAGCDEAGRGCLAGPVCAAAVILPPDFAVPGLTDSKKLSGKRRLELRDLIKAKAIAWAISFVEPEEIDRMNILNASIMAMHRALDGLKVRPDAIASTATASNPTAIYRHRHSSRATDGLPTLPPPLSWPRPPAMKLWSSLQPNIRPTDGMSTRATPPKPTAPR